MKNKNIDIVSRQITKCAPKAHSILFAIHANGYSHKKIVHTLVHILARSQTATNRNTIHRMNTENVHNL